MEKSFWQDRWQRGETGFHQPHIHDLLERHWGRLGVAPDARVFVPLCGKSQDMVWLAKQGHEVVGAELSEIAVAEFFRDAGLSPEISAQGPFSLYSAGPYQIFCGDIFELTPAMLGPTAAAYDRAALIALPAAMRPRYVKTLAALLTPRVPTLLIAIDYPEGEIDGPPFPVAPAEVRTLFEPAFDLDILETRDGLAASQNLKQRGITRLDETAYSVRLRP